MWVQYCLSDLLVNPKRSYYLIMKELIWINQSLLWRKLTDRIKLMDHYYLGDLIRIYRSGWWLSLWQNLIRRIGSLIVMVRSEDIDGIDGSLLWRDPTKHLALGGHSLLGLLPPYYHRPWQWWLFGGEGGFLWRSISKIVFFSRKIARQIITTVEIMKTSLAAKHYYKTFDMHCMLWHTLHWD